jgi:hypothetical protein
VALAALVIGGESVRAVGWAEHVRNRGLGYNSREWKRSDLIRFARSLPEGTLVYSNAPDALSLAPNVSARTIPEVMHPSTHANVTDYYQRQLRVMRHDLRVQGGYLFYFRDVTRTYLVSEQQLTVDLSLLRVRKGRDGMVYSVDSTASPK